MEISVVFLQGQTDTGTEQSPEADPITHSQMTFDQGTKINQWRNQSIFQ